MTEGKKRIRYTPAQRRNREKIEVVDTPCHVRVATKDDFFGIIELSRMVHDENGLFDFNEVKVAEAIWLQIEKKNGIIGVIGTKDKLEGIVVLRLSTYWYSNSQFLEEMFVFVHPDFRKAKDSRAQKLLEFAKKVSSELEMPLMIGVLSNTRTSAKVSLYERNFGEPAGAFFLWGAKTGHQNEN
jgi:hypothetical protein